MTTKRFCSKYTCGDVDTIHLITPERHTNAGTRSLVSSPFINKTRELSMGYQHKIAEVNKNC